MSSSSPDPETLLKHGPWLRGLARSLVGDEATADDLVQETWAAALKSPPREGSRAWLSRVVHNCARKRHRTESRRRRRETEVARSRTDSEEASADWVEQMELHRRVVEAVLALPEPYREMVVRRYFHEATPTEIAVRLELPVKTVKTRLRRALERLRRELDDRYGSRAAWAVVALPLAKSAVPIGVATTASASSVSVLEWLGGFVMAGSKSVAVAAAILVIVVAAWWWSDFSGGASDRQRGRSEVASVESLGATGGAREGSVVESDESVSSRVPPEATVRGRVVDRENGEPVVGASVEWVSHFRPMTGGWYLRKGTDHREATRPGETTLGELMLSMPFDPRRETTSGGAGGVTDEAGEFELAAAPDGARYLRVAHDEYRYEWRPVDEVQPALRFEVHRKRWVTLDIRGADGRVPDLPRALVNAYVYGQLDAAPEWEIYRSFHWDENGIARIELPDVHRVRVSISAPKFGWVSEAVEAIGGSLALDLDLEPHPFVGARVIDTAGNPIAGVEAVVFQESAAQPNRSGTVIRCGDDGHFIANVRADGPVYVAFTADGFAGTEVDHLERGRDDQTVVLEEATLATVRGVVVGGEAPSEGGWTVELVSASLSGAPLVVEADEAGRFTIEAVPYGRYDAVVWSTNDGVRSRWVGLEGTPFEVGERSLNVELSVSPEAGSIVGSVETPEQGPVTDTMIFLDRVSLLGGAETISVTVPDDHGRYAFSAVPAGRYLVKVGFGASNSQLVRVRAGETSEADFGRDSRRVTLEVRRRGEPVPDASVIAGRFDTTGAMPLLTDVRAARTDASGRTGKRLYRAGRYLVRVERAGSVFVETLEIATEERTPLTVPLSWPDGSLTIEADEPGAITVDLLELEGIEVEAAVPVAQRRIAFARTSPDSTAGIHRVAIEGVRSASYQLTFTPESGPPRTRTVQVPPSGLRLRMDSSWQAGN